MANFVNNIAVFEDINIKPKAIVFDWDNTLADTWPLIHEAINEVMSSYDKPLWSLQEVKDKIHKSMRESFPEIFGNKWQEAGKIYVDSYARNHLSKLSLLPGSLHLLEYLNDNDIRVFLVSNKIGTTLRKEVASLNLGRLFFSVIGAGDADKDKPSVDPVQLALKGSDVDFVEDEIWFIGDTIADIKCGQNCSFRPIIYSHDKGEISKTISSSVDFNDKVALYHDHKDLIALLARLK